MPSPRKVDGDLVHTHADYGYEASKQKIQDMQATIDCYVSPYPIEPAACSSDTDISDSISINLSKSRSCRAILTTMSSPPLSEKAEQNATTPPDEFHRDFNGKSEGYPLNSYKSKPDANSEMLLTKDSRDGSDSMDEKEQNTKTSPEDDTAMGHNEVLKPKSEMQFGDNTVQEAEPNKNEVHGPPHYPSNWPLDFERQRKEIIELWDACYIPLVHRTYFFLLFQGEPSDSVYMEVELRRLSFLKQTLCHGTSTRALNHERDMLSKQMLKKFSTKERKALYQKWGIKLDSKKRRHQLSRRLWRDTEDTEHIKESSALVAKLVGEPGQVPKEIFGLSFFSPQQGKLKPYSWKHNMSSLRGGNFASF